MNKATINKLFQEIEKSNKPEWDKDLLRKIVLRQAEEAKHWTIKKYVNGFPIYIFNEK